MFLIFLPCLSLAVSFREPLQAPSPVQESFSWALPALTLALEATLATPSPGGGGGGGLTASALKVALTARASDIVTLQAPGPVQAPDQPAKVEPEAGVAFSVTSVSASKEALQVEPQSIPVGELVTVPCPVPTLLTLSVRDSGSGSRSKLALISRSSVISTRQAGTPSRVGSESQPLQPENSEPASGLAVSVTASPSSNSAPQMLGHSIPAGELSTAPAPVPSIVTSSANSPLGSRSKIAVAASGSSTASTHSTSMPAQSPSHSANSEPISASA